MCLRSCLGRYRPKHDLTHAYAYFEIVELLAEAERFADALAWAERGLAVFPDGTDSRLVDVAARELIRADRDGEAMSILWRRLEESPTESSYELLKLHASSSGCWGEWRDRALGHLRVVERAARERRQSAGARLSTPRFAPRFLDPRPESSEIVSILLGEDDADGAWEQAQLGGCSPTLWMQLAGIREAEHPEDAVPIYEREAERSIETKNSRGYEEGVELMAKLRDLLVRTSGGEALSSYADEVRRRHKPKRNLMKLLDQKGW